jgi:hypothetical protein
MMYVLVRLGLVAGAGAIAVSAVGAQIRTPIATEPVSTSTPGPGPLNAKAVATSPTSAAVSWDPAVAIRAYTVDRRPVDNSTCCASQSGLISTNGWNDGSLQSGVTYAYTISVLYTDGRVGSTEVWVTPPMPSVSVPLSAVRGATLLATQPCTPTNKPGPQPTIRATWQSPAGLTMAWTNVGANYAIHRAPEGTTNWTFVGSTCGGPSPVTQVVTNGVVAEYTVRDVSGGVSGKQVYRVTAVGGSGETGWNTIHWTPTCRTAPTFTSASANGSTVTLSWSRAGSCDTWSTIPPSSDPSSITITSSYGYVRTTGYASTTMSIWGVPLGTHTFTLTALWSPDFKRSRSVQVTVQY